MNNHYRPDADGSGRFINPNPPTDLKPGEVSVCIDGQWTPLKSLLGLKAENAQLTAENQRLRDGFGAIETVSANYDKWSSHDKIKHAITTSRKYLQSPPTPGLGAAMLRVLEEAKLIHKFYKENDLMPLYPDENYKLHQAIQALNELESN